MKMKRKTLFILLIILMLVPTGAALADDKVVESGDTVNEDIVLFDDNLDVAAGATVNGDITIFDGDVTIAGTINGDVVLFDGDLVVESTAVIHGDCVVMSGVLTDNTAAGLNCTSFAAPELGALADGIPPLPALPPLPSSIEVSQPSGFVRFLGGVGGAIFQSLILGLIAFGVATLFPQHLVRIEKAVRQKPVASGTVGFLTSLALPFLMLVASPILVLLAFVCGLGVLLGIALLLAFAGAVLLGWISMGRIFGDRLTTWLNLKDRSLPVTTALGTAVLTLIIGVFGAIPFVFGEGLVVFVISCIGLGAVALTKFGTRTYPHLAGGGDIRILAPENEAKVNAVLDSLPDESDTLK